MSNKHKVTKKKMASLGLKKTENGDYNYINPESVATSQYNTVRKESK